MRILIVEDDPILRMYMEEVLSGYGDCATAEDGEEGVEAFKAALGEGRAFGAVFMDLRMPVLDGDEALARIRAFERESGVARAEAAKAFIVSAVDDMEAESGGLSGLSAIFLSKPLTIEKIAGVMAELRGETNA